MLRKDALKISEMSCAACTANIEKKLGKLDDVRSASVNLATEKASVDFDASEAIPGRGVMAFIDSKLIYLGTSKLMLE